MKEQLEKLKKQALNELESLKNNEDVLAFQEKYFGRKSGELSLVLRELKNVATEFKPAMGAFANTVKNELEEALGSKLKDLGGDMVADVKGEDWIDPTISIDRYKLGNLHPMTQIIRDVEDTFVSMGFMVLDGPEIESDFYNFEGLNIPSWHPARDSQDTFYVDDGSENELVMRTHTSPVQVRAMQKYGAPLRALVPGRTFRNEATDASHDHTFYQVEGLMIDENISFANLIATLQEAVSGIFKKDLKVRTRPGYFPFVEPGLEVDISCAFCDAKGCSVCKQTGWIEMIGAGLIHPNVLEHGGIDSKKYQGFAFGLGLTRLLMLKYGVSDIRLLQSGDLRFLKQF